MTSADSTSTRTPLRPPRAPLRSLVGSCAVVVACAVLAACGSSSHSPSSTSSAAALATTRPNAATLVRARVAAASCMRAQGINIPDPGVGAGSLLAILRDLAAYPSVKIQTAEKACASQIRQAFPNATSLSPAQRAQRVQEGIAFSDCMRSHGIDFPDPRTAANNPSAYYQALGSLDVNSPAFKAAGQICRPVALRAGGTG
ncbi:MAG: hypothetical protein ACLP01_01130 [Solirubrobacteraceae bacterium]